MARSSGIAALFSLLAASNARAAGTGREEHRVDFEANQVEIAGTDSELSLSGDVVVRAERFQLTADEVTLSRSPRGLHVEGSGRLAFCPCKHPLITLGFAAADLAPPTDVLLKHATVRVFGVPVFYSPYLWLRAPTQLGVLPPAFEYRGEEGLFIRTGAHLPLARRPEQPTIADIDAGAYLAGGARVTGELRGPSGRARLGWDYFRGSAWDGEADFATMSESAATLAGSIRMLRGERALIAPSSIDAVALRTDRARLGVGTVHPAMFAVSVTGTSPRGSAMDAVPVLGPLFELGRSVALGSHAVASFLLETEALRTGAGPVSVSALHGELSGSVPAGPVLTEIWLRERARALTRENGDALSFDAEVRSRLALPLARRYGRWIHRVEPVVEGAVGTRRLHLSGDAGAPNEAPISERLTLLAGFESAVGAEDDAADLRLMGGVSGRAHAEEGVVAARVRTKMAFITFDTEARMVPRVPALEAFARAEAGSADALQAALHLEGRHDDPDVLDRLFYDDFTRPEVPWLREAGVSAGGSLLFPLGFGLRGGAGLEFDVSRERFLGGSGTVGYRHVCGCVDVALAMTKRMGRDDFDVMLHVDLVP